MTPPQGARHFPAAAIAKAAAENAVKTDFIVLRCNSEFAWISPVSVFTERGARAIMAGIQPVEVVK